MKVIRANLSIEISSGTERHFWKKRGRLGVRNKEEFLGLGVRVWQGPRKGTPKEDKLPKRDCVVTSGLQGVKQVENGERHQYLWFSSWADSEVFMVWLG